MKCLIFCSLVFQFLFIAFGLMFFIPGYPVLCGAFFLTLGIFQSFQNSRETNDILYTSLLPVAKRDVVKAKYAFCCFIEICGFTVMAAVTLLRMTVLRDAQVYRANSLMNANLFALGMAAVIFGIFNSVFVGGFFKTAYKFGKPFVCHIVITFITIFIAEALRFVPGCEKVNAFGFEELPLQLLAFAAGILCWVILTLVSYAGSCRNFEKIDL